VNQASLKKFQNLIEGTLSSLMYEHYPAYMETYMRYRNRTGPQCPFCKKAAEYMFTAEFARNGQAFIDRFNTNNFEEYV